MSTTKRYNSNKIFIADSIISWILILGSLALIILYIVGLSYSTDLIFKDKKTSEYTKTQGNLMKMFVVLTIVNVVFNIFNMQRKL